MLHLLPGVETHDAAGDVVKHLQGRIFGIDDVYDAAARILSLRIVIEDRLRFVLVSLDAALDHLLVRVKTYEDESKPILDYYAQGQYAGRGIVNVINAED